MFFKFCSIFYIVTLRVKELASTYSRVFTCLFCLIALSPFQLEDPIYAMDPNHSGVIIMAHGGSQDWNKAVSNAVAPLLNYCPTEIAFGMAHRGSLQKAISNLEEKGVRRIAVVRLFVSGDSFLEQTEYFLGLRSEPPQYFLHHDNFMDMTEPRGNKSVQLEDMLVSSKKHPLKPIKFNSALALTQKGLYDSSLITQIVAERVNSLSRNPSNESVLILAHGEGDDNINSKWIERIERLSKAIQNIGSFRKIRIETLREDWKHKKKIAEAKIRKFVSVESKIGEVLVVPFRVYGFGPIESVLKNLEYRSDGRGLLPHPIITKWLMKEASQCFQKNSWPNPFPEGK